MLSYFLLNSRFAISFQQFDCVLKALEEGKPIDLSKMPPPPPGCTGLYHLTYKWMSKAK